MTAHLAKANAPGQGGVEATNQSVQPLQYSPKSTAAEAQRQRTLEELRIAPRTSYDLRRLGCYQAPARVLELRRMGYDIRTERVTIWDRDGYRHCGVALYHLHEEVA